MERYLEAPSVLFRIGPIPITETLLNSWMIMLVMLAAGFLLTRRLVQRPRGKQSLVELVVQACKGLLSMGMGERRMGFLGYMGSLMLFLLLSNLVGLTGLRPPTSDLNVTMGMALLTFVMIQYYGVSARGLGGYLKSLGEPVFFMFPVNVIGELAKPISLGMRLFGNILGGSIIMAMIYGILPVALPVPFHLYFDVFVGVLQAFIFVVLTMVFVNLAVE